MWQRFTDRARGVFHGLSAAAIGGKESELLGPRLVLGLADKSDLASGQLLRRSGIDLKGLCADLKALLPTDGEAVAFNISSGVRTAIDFAGEEAGSNAPGSIDTHHLLIGVVRADEGVATVFAKYGHTADSLRQILAAMAAEGQEAQAAVSS